MAPNVLNSVFGYGFYSTDRVSIRRVSCTISDQPADVVDKSFRSRVVGKGCKLVGCGSAVPSLEISNHDLSKILDTNDEWISTRTGIHNRRILTGKENLTGLAVEAAQKALEMADVHPDDVDLVLLCSSTADDLFGGAPQVQAALGCKGNPLAFDITAACSGFLLGIVSASCYIRGGGFKNVLVIGADAPSRLVDWTDRGTCILFGDAAGAVLVQLLLVMEEARGSSSRSVVQAVRVGDLVSKYTDKAWDELLEKYPCLRRHLKVSFNRNETKGSSGSNGSFMGFPPNGASYSFLQMNGKEVFKFACRVVPQSIEIALENAGMTSSSINWLLLHQANQRILDRVATHLEFPGERVISNLASYGNTSAASIPLALDEAVRSGKIKSGETIATAGFGAGLTWGSAIIRWN